MQKRQDIRNTIERIRERFYKQVDMSGDCWNWTGPRDADGYGHAYAWNRRWRAHRLSYYLSHGDIPADVCVCHSCDNRSCVNPAHLFLGTHAENIADRNNKGRQARGTQINTDKLTAEQVLELRRRHGQGEKAYRLAREFGISHSSAWRIVHRLSWKHLP